MGQSIGKGLIQIVALLAHGNRRLDYTDYSIILMPFCEFDVLIQTAPHNVVY